MSKNTPYFNPINPRVSFPALEEETLKFWQKKDIFKKSIENRSEDKRWTFLDGPPFITGQPHYGTLLSSIPKDLYPRFWTMKGYRVRRVWGWDCHGLPAENKVENKLGIKRKKDIEEKIGVKKFIDECKLYVSEVSGEWKWYVDHVARWVDFDNAYKTMDRDYMESVMWVFKQMYDKDFIYKGLRVSLYCPHCSTPISNFEVAMDPDNYKEITESANTYKYKVSGQDNTYFLAWSTTPWNKIATPALAVNPELMYVKVKQGDEYFILGKDRLAILKDEPKYKILEEVKGQSLVGMEYEAHYDFYKIDKGKRAFVIVGGDFVSSEEGTGIVTIAAYGEDDLKAMKENDIQIVLHVDDEGMLTPDVPMWGGMYYLDVNEKVNKDLEERGLMYDEAQHTHSVPTCWRCHTRLYYAPQNAWYVDIQKLKPKLFDNNEEVNWFPEHFKNGRFKKSVEFAPDWCVSRSRYWGSPVPVWECECGERIVPGSISELEKLSGEKVTELHKPEIDEITIKCPKCGKEVKRVPEVLDSWIEAGSASFAERHFPFNKDVNLEDFFPPDFIVEYTGQIRAWFYVLHVIATAIYDSNAFKNVVVTGVILGTDGRKMSKNYGNYPDPKELIEKYGGDALRVYLMGSPVMRGEDILISEDDYRNQVKNFLLPLWNVYNFFVTYANIDMWEPRDNLSRGEAIDRFILSRLESLKRDVTSAFESYDTPQAVALLQEFLVNDLSGWYVRRIRERVGPTAENARSKDLAYQTLWEVLGQFCLLAAPLSPFVTEEIYRNITKEESVHLKDWPVVDESLMDEGLEEEMTLARKIVEAGHSERKRLQLKVRQPLSGITVSLPDRLSKDVEELIKIELNVLGIVWKKGSEISVTLDTELTPELVSMGQMREVIRSIQEQRKQIGTTLTEKVDVSLPEWPEKYTEEIKRRALVNDLSKGEFSVKKTE